MLLTDTGRMVREAMGWNGLSNRTLAEESGINKKTVENIVENRVYGVLPNVVRLMDVMGFHVKLIAVEKEAADAKDQFRRQGHIDSLFSMLRESRANRKKVALAYGYHTPSKLTYYWKIVEPKLSAYIRAADAMGYDVMVHKRGAPIDESIIVVDQRIYFDGLPTE